MLTRIKPPKRQPERGPGITTLTPKERDEAIAQQAMEIISSGTQAEHCWFIRMIVPEKYRQGPSDKGDDRIACAPGYMIPVVPFSEDPTGKLTDLLVFTFVYSNPPDTIFYKTLTTRTLLNEAAAGRWYEWGDWVEDHICPDCGRVFRLKMFEEWQGCDCRYPRSAQPRRSFVDGVLYELKAADDLR